MPSKEPQSITLADFADLSDAPAGRGGQQRKINWDAVLEAVNTQPMTNAQVFSMIIKDKDTYLFDEGAVDPNKGTIWTKLNKWASEKVIRKAVLKKTNTVYYGPIG
jgi:hypothetical protein